MSNPTPSRLETLKELVQDLEAQEADRLARERHLASRQHQRYVTRRRILAGTVVLELAQKDPKTDQWLMTQLSAQLTRPTDRAFFNLPPPLKKSK